MRLHGRNAAKWWHHELAEDRYDYLYTSAELTPFSETADATSRLVKKLSLYLNKHFAANAVANAVGLKDQLGLPTPGQYPLDFAAQYPEVDGIVKLTASANPLFPLDRTARRHRSPSVSQPSRAVYRPTCVTPSRGHRLLTAHVPQRGYTGRQTFCPQVTKYRLIDTHQRRGATS